MSADPILTHSERETKKKPATISAKIIRLSDVEPEEVSLTFPPITVPVFDRHWSY